MEGAAGLLVADPASHAVLTAAMLAMRLPLVPGQPAATHGAVEPLAWAALPREGRLALLAAGAARLDRLGVRPTGICRLDSAPPQPFPLPSTPRWVDETARAIASAIGQPSPSTSGMPAELVAELKASLCAVCRNGFAVPLPRSAGVASRAAHGPTRDWGTALFVVAAMVNHSCEPTATVRFGPESESPSCRCSVPASCACLGARANPFTLRIEALPGGFASLGSSPGAELTVAYGPLASETPEASRRRLATAADHWFECECPACSRAPRAALPEGRPTGEAGSGEGDGAGLGGGGREGRAGQGGSRRRRQQGAGRRGKAPEREAATVIPSPFDPDAALLARVSAGGEVVLVCASSGRTVSDAEAIRLSGRQRAAQRRAREGLGFLATPEAGAFVGCFGASGLGGWPPKTLGSKAWQAEARAAVAKGGKMWQRVRSSVAALAAGADEVGRCLAFGSRPRDDWAAGVAGACLAALVFEVAAASPPLRDKSMALVRAAAAGVEASLGLTTPSRPGPRPATCSTQATVRKIARDFALVLVAAEDMAGSRRTAAELRELRRSCATLGARP